jgi:hypothetical protein
LTAYWRTPALFLRQEVTHSPAAQKGIPWRHDRRETARGARHAALSRRYRHQGRGDRGIGSGNDEADETIDAGGLIVGAGFRRPARIDAPWLFGILCTLSSGRHHFGVIGNCGFGFAPVRPAERERAMLTMTRRGDPLAR